MTERTIHWAADPLGGRDCFIASADGRPVAYVARRPNYCDRGHWQVWLEFNAFPDLDHQDAFPRYFMRAETAKQELEDFIRWRLWKIRAPQTVPTAEIFR
jgi:hypothetical protein